MTRTAYQITMAVVLVNGMTVNLWDFDDVCLNSPKVIELSSSIALLAAKLSLDLKLPMADSIILATAQIHGAVLWTQDNDFEGISDVHYFPKRSAASY